MGSGRALEALRNDALYKYTNTLLLLYQMPNIVWNATVINMFTCCRFLAVVQVV